MKFDRSSLNPIITKEDLKPTNPFFKIDGVFNAGATIFNDEVILILRVAQSLISDDLDLVKIPYYDNNVLKVKTLDKVKDAHIYDFSDSRHPFYKGTKQVACLTSISHFQLARSFDGFNFTIDDEIFMQASNKYEAWGIEDARVVLIEEEYYINYTGCSQYGAMTLLAKTKDFKQVERLGIMFAPENKDVCLFSEKIKGRYYAYHRPVPKAFGHPDIYI
ncbi:MAG: glycosidase, partial [Bacilli bacterium]